MKWNHPAVALTGIALVSLLCYVNALPNALITDDLQLIDHHPALNEPGNLRAMLGSGSWGANDYLYRPLSLWSYTLNHRANELVGLSGRQTTGYHLVNLLLHAAVGCALFTLLRRLLGETGPALVAALLFATHPLHTEAVVTLVGRAELLAAVLGLSFLLLHRSGRAALATICLLLALGSKESAIAFVPLAIWMDLCFAPARPPRRVLRYGIYAAAALAWLALRGWVLAGTPHAVPFIDNPLVEASSAGRLLTAARVQLDYLLLLLLPVRLSSDYSYDQIPVIESLAHARVLGFALVAAGAAALAWTTQRTHPIVPFTVGGYAILFFATSNVPLIIGTIMGERLAYSPSLAACALAGYGLWLLRRRAGPRVLAVIATILVAFSTLTALRNRTWAEIGPHVRAQVASAPASAKAHLNLAVHQFHEGHMAAARADCAKALSIFPGYAEAWNRLGMIRDEAGEFDEAATAYERATRIFPGYAEAWDNLGAARVNRGDPRGALPAYERAIELRPDVARYHYRLGQARQMLGLRDPAAASYLEALALDPGLVSAYVNLGILEAERGRRAEAKRMWRRALELDPLHGGARRNLQRLEAMEASPEGGGRSR